MKNRVFPLLSIMNLCIATMLTGCWNYRETEKLTIVAGVAIDKGTKSKYLITTEIVEISGGKDSKPVSRLLTMEGNTIFDAVRNEISISGKKLYWSHAKVVILSKDLASEGILRIVDWMNRDSETRADVLLFVSKEKKAKDIFKGSGATNQIMSFELAEMAKNETSLTKAPKTELWKFVNELEAPGISPVIPAIHFKSHNNQKVPQIMGTAIFNKDMLMGFLNGEETKNLLFILDEVKGGLFITNGTNGSSSAPIALEIFRSKTKTKPIIKNNKITFNIQIHTTAALGEVGDQIKILDEKGIKQLEDQAEKKLTVRIENCIKHIQSSYGVDVFGFGRLLREENPKLWSKVESRWEKDYFKNLQVRVISKVHIKGSGLLSDPIQKGD